MKYLLIMKDGEEAYACEHLFDGMGEVAQFLADGDDDNATVQVFQFADNPQDLGAPTDVTVTIANAVQATMQGRFEANDWQGDLTLHPIIAKATDQYLAKDVDLYQNLDAAITEGGKLDSQWDEDVARFGL